MSKRTKNTRLVYSIFSTELQDYPYYPFIAKNDVIALNKFINFLSHRDTICEGAELHLIGECKVNPQGDIIDGSLQPYVIPCVVGFKNNVVSKTFICGSYYLSKIHDYLKKIYELLKKEYFYGKNK